VTINDIGKLTQMQLWQAYTYTQPPEM